MIILGIDPGFSATGYSILKKESSVTSGFKSRNQITLLDHGFLKMSASQSLDLKIGIFHDLFADKIKLYGVTVISLETPFLGKNAQTFLKLGYLRGILYLLAHQHKLSICEFAPRQVKQNVTGYGAASKEQVANVLLMLFPQIPKPLKEDVTDAIAVSLCGLWQSESRSTLK